MVLDPSVFQVARLIKSDMPSGPPQQPKPDLAALAS